MKNRAKKSAKIKALERFNSLYTPEQRKIFTELTERQQIISLDIPVETCCYICGLKSKIRFNGNDGKLIIHHVRYIPIETIVLCWRCHSYLHGRFLRRKKCKPEIKN